MMSGVIHNMLVDIRWWLVWKFMPHSAMRDAIQMALKEKWPEVRFGA